MSNTQNRVAVSRGGVICPGCGKTSYSLGGIHPQCAVELADAARKKQLSAENQAAAQRQSAVPDSGRLAWNMKRCPNCRIQYHMRTRHCACGYDFFASPR